MTAVLAVTGILLQTFDAASIKPSSRARVGGEGSKGQSIDRSPVSVTMVNVPLSACIQFAYDVKFYQVEGPDWINSERFDVIAKSASPAGADEHRRMMQALLADRFKLQLHRGLKEHKVYVLFSAGGEPKLKASTPGTPTRLHVAGGGFVFENTTMVQFAEKLSDFRTIDRPVVDRTGITGSFDFTFRDAAAAMLEADGAPITVLIRELGLKLEPGKEKLEVLIVDHAEKTPTEN